MPDFIPGPWQWSCSSFDPNGGEPCHCSVGKIAPWGGFYIAHISSDVHEYEKKAVAQLIAAAPDMYDTLWTLTEHLKLYYGENHSCVIQGEAALAKARGET